MKKSFLLPIFLLNFKFAVASVSAEMSNFSQIYNPKSVTFTFVLPFNYGGYLKERLSNEAYIPIVLYYYNYLSYILHGKFALSIPFSENFGIGAFVGLSRLGINLFVNTDLTFIELRSCLTGSFSFIETLYAEELNNSRPCVSLDATSLLKLAPLFKPYVSLSVTRGEIVCDLNYFYESNYVAIAGVGVQLFNSYLLGYNYTFSFDPDYVAIHGISFSYGMSLY